jgi:hypothetical protein
MRTTKVWRLIVLVAILVSLVAGQATLARDESPDGDVSIQESRLMLGTGLPRLHVTSETARIAVPTTSEFTTIPIALSFKVPAGKTQMALIRFSSNSSCSGAQGAICILDVRINGNKHAHPRGHIVFDSADTADPAKRTFESHSLEKVTDCLAPGNYKITIVADVFGSPTTPALLELDDSVLIVQRADKCSDVV